MLNNEILGLAHEIAQSNTTIVFAGAGLSTASGIPDFRGEDGLWKRYDPENFSIHAFRADPKSFWSQYRELHQELIAGEDYQPNAAHRALADLTNDNHVEAVITQNVDGLQANAGTDPEKIIKLHGDSKIAVCMECDRTSDLESRVLGLSDNQLPPTCKFCEGILKPGGVLFGEQLPRKELNRARELSGNCDTFVVLGSSLTVEPAASLPERAVGHGATLAIVNLDSTALDRSAAFTFHRDVTEILPTLTEQLKSLNTK